MQSYLVQFVGRSVTAEVVLEAEFKGLDHDLEGKEHQWFFLGLDVIALRIEFAKRSSSQLIQVKALKRIRNCNSEHSRSRANACG